MSFSRNQQPAFRLLVRDAWFRQCAVDGTEPGPVPRSWYESELEIATGCRSTVDCDSKSDFERAMAHFEVLAENGIGWQMKLHSGDARRLLHALHDCGLAEDYLLRIARNMFPRGAIQSLADLTAQQLASLLSAAKIFVRRRSRIVPEPPSIPR